jgi:Voltage-dependent anion channel
LTGWPALSCQLTLRPGHHGVLRDLQRPVDVFAHLGPNWFASLMGTGIMATAAAALPVQWPGVRGFAAAAWVLRALWLVTLTGTEVAHWARHRIEALGGTFSMHSPLGSGTAVSCDLRVLTDGSPPDATVANSR